MSALSLTHSLTADTRFSSRTLTCFTFSLSRTHSSSFAIPQVSVIQSIFSFQHDRIPFPILPSFVIPTFLSTIPHYRLGFLFLPVIYSFRYFYFFVHSYDILQIYFFYFFFHISLFSCSWFALFLLYLLLPLHTIPLFPLPFPLSSSFSLVLLLVPLLVILIVA